MLEKYLYLEGNVADTVVDVCIFFFFQITRICSLSFKSYLLVLLQGDILATKRETIRHGLEMRLDGLTGCLTTVDAFKNGFKQFQITLNSIIYLFYLSSMLVIPLVTYQ